MTPRTHNKKNIRSLSTLTSRQKRDREKASPSGTPQAICQLARMGDLVQMIPLLESISAEGPVTLYCDQAVEDWAKLLPGISAIVPLDTRGWRRACTEAALSLPALVKELNLTLRPDDRLQRLFALNDHPVCDAVCALVSFRNQTIRLNERIVLLRSYLRLIGENRSLNSLHLSDLWRSLALGTRRRTHLQVSVPATGMQFAEHHLRSLRQARVKRIFAFLLGSGGKYRRLTPDYFSGYWNNIHNKMNAGLVLLGGNGEEESARQFIEMTFPRTNAVVNLTGKCSPEELLGVLSQVDVVVGVDTGPLHWAAALGTKVLGLYFGEAGFRETGPYGDGHFILAPDCADYPCNTDRAQACGYQCRRQYATHEDIAQLIIDCAADRRLSDVHSPNGLQLWVSAMESAGIRYHSRKQEESQERKLLRDQLLDIFALTDAYSNDHPRAMPHFWNDFITLWTEEIQRLQIGMIRPIERLTTVKEQAIQRLNSYRSKGKTTPDKQSKQMATICASCC